jgi:hypothetical protein
VTGQRRVRRPPRWVVTALAAAIVVQFTAGVVGTAYLAAGERLAASAPDNTLGRPAPRIAGDVAITPVRERARRATAIRSLLARRSEALLHRDRTGFLAGIDAESPDFRARQGRLFDNLREVPLGKWSYLVDPDHEMSQSGGRLSRFHAPVWAPQVDVIYRLAGFDRRDTSQRQYFTFVQRGARWYIGADDDFANSGGQTARGLWDFGPVVVARTATTLVLGHPGSRDTLRTITQVAAAAIPRVSAVWGHDWAGKVVILVPDSQAELSRVIQAGELSQIAAVATAELAGGTGLPAGERIIINPPNFAKLGSLGRQVVLRHEITHVATRAVTTDATPTWLAEGFADYIGYLGTGVPVGAAGHELAVDIRAGRVPKALPTNADFGGNNSRLAQVYEMSWLACRMIAAAVGPDGLVRFYRAVGGGPGTSGSGVEDALRTRLGLSMAQFTVRWRAYLSNQLA